MLIAINMVYGVKKLIKELISFFLLLVIREGRLLAKNLVQFKSKEERKNDSNR